MERGGFVREVERHLPPPIHALSASEQGKTEDLQILKGVSYKKIKYSDRGRRSYTVQYMLPSSHMIAMQCPFD
jgi:hypothetical protein